MTDAFKNRVLVGAVLLVLLFATLYAGRTVFSVFVLGMILIAGFEWGKLANLSKRASLVYAGAVGVLSITWFGASPYMAYVVGVSIALMLWNPRWTVLAGIMVLPYTFAIITLLIHVSDQRYGVWWLMVVYVWTAVMIMDSGAYVVGKRFGKNLLCPRISPAKTWEGLLGGLVLTMGASAIFYLAMEHTYGLQHMNLWVAGTGFIASFAQLGDLCESKMKRTVGVKDSGTILQQHGGVLDRIDGLIGALVVIGVIFEGVL